MEDKFELEDGRTVDMSAALPLMQDYADLTNAEIKIHRGPEFLATAKAVSEYMGLLHLPNTQNNRLVRLMVDHVLAAERNGFSQGLDMGVKLGKWLAENPEDNEE